MEAVLLGVLVLGAVLAFPLYVLARLGQLELAVQELKSRLARMEKAASPQERQPSPSHRAVGPAVLVGHP